MKEFYVRTKRVWVKVSRLADKSFIFAIGYTNDFKAFSITKYSHEFVATISEASDLAKAKAADFA